MKVILLAELKGRGGEGDVIDVARGYATNYLLPQKLAIEASAGNLKQLEQRRHNIKKREDIRLAEAGDFRNVLDGKKVSISVKVGDAGRLFGSVTAVMIAEAINEQLGIEVDRRKIETHGAIKTVGTQDIEVSVYRDIKAHLAVDIVAEGTVEIDEKEAELAAEIEAAKKGEPKQEFVAPEPELEAEAEAEAKTGGEVESETKEEVAIEEEVELVEEGDTDTDADTDAD